jgi:xylono-1,5-lactonase
MDTTAKTLLKLENKLGESPIWHAARRRLYWVDLYAPALFECRLDGTYSRKRALAIEAPIGSIVATTDPDQIVIALKSGLHLLHLDTLALTFYCDPEQGRGGIIPNDLKVDRWGRLWFGTSHEKETEAVGALWCVKDRETWAKADSGFPVSNGPAFSQAGHTMYFNDSVNRRTLVYDISPTHLRAENRRSFATFSESEGVPDGIAVDRQDVIWIAMWAGASLQRLSHNGSKLQRISVPAHNVTSLCFAGERRDHIIITSAREGLSRQQLFEFPNSGSLFHHAEGSCGVPEPVFLLR